jgi:iron(III) transport system substrate-binding protein
MRMPTGLSRGWDARAALRRFAPAAFIAAIAGCGVRPAVEDPAAKPRGGPKEVVVYTALDREFSEPILTDLGRELGLAVQTKFDVESTKTVGLTNSIISEAVRPRCDLFWNNEILNTIRLKERGLLQPFRPAHAGDVPPGYADRDDTWYGFAARARILIVNTKLVSEKERPAGLLDLCDSRWKGKVGIAKPLFGTTATHATCLFVAWGDEKAGQYFRDLKANGVQVLSGNKQVAAEVGAGRLAFGLTDTDDAMGEVEAGNPVAIVYPDREPGQLGTLFIPNTIAVIKGAPHPEEARRLADRILDPAVEGRLADGPSAQIPLLKGSKTPARMQTPATLHAMEADFEAAAKAWDRVSAFLLAEFAE